MPGSWDYRAPSLWDRRRVRKPTSSHLVGLLFVSGVGQLLACTGALSSNSGQYNRSVLISAIRVARAGSRLWATPRDYARDRAWSRLWSNHRTREWSCKVRPDSIGVSRWDGAVTLPTSPHKSLRCAV
jgi:hypothetical protein